MPGTSVTPSFTSTVDVLMVVGSMASAKDTSIELLRGTLTALLAGLTVGALTESLSSSEHAPSDKTSAIEQNDKR